MQEIEIVRGTTCPVYIALTDADGAPLVLDEEDRLLLGVIPVHGGDRLLLKVAEEGEDPGDYVFRFAPADTVNLPAEDYRYDVNWEHGEDFLNVVKLSPLRIVETTTEKGDGA